MKNIPKLRFPEFVNDGEWEEKKISDVCEKPYSGGTPSSTVKEYYGGNIPFIRSAEIDKAQTELFLTNEGLKNSSAKFVKKGDVLIALYGANSGDVAISKIEGAINQAILCLNSKESNSFLYQYLVLKKDWIVTKYIQGGQGNLSGEIIKSIELKFPKPKEQQKIADCLSSVDSLISAQSQKVELLKEHKKGLMQQLFPQDGEEVPKLRFPEFINATKWEEKKLGDICDITNGKANAQDHIEDGIYPLFDRSAVVKQTNNYLFDCEAVIIPGEGMRFIPKYYKGKFDLHQRAYALQNFKCDAKFIYYSMNFLKEVLATKAVQSTVLSLRLPILQNFMISMPPDKDTKEQQKIADFLSSIDEQIGSQARKLQTLKEHKKALMQQLFPSKEV